MLTLVRRTCAIRGRTGKIRQTSGNCVAVDCRPFAADPSIRNRGRWMWKPQAWRRIPLVVVVVVTAIRALWRSGSSRGFATATGRRWPDERAIAAAGFQQQQRCRWAPRGTISRTILYESRDNCENKTKTKQKINEIDEVVVNERLPKLNWARIYSNTGRWWFVIGEKMKKKKGK